MIQIQVDTQGQMVAIGQRLERLAFEAPNVLRLSLNAAARQVRKQLTRDVADTYTVDDSVLKDSSKGAPRLQTAKPGKMEAVIRSKGPMLDLLEFMVRSSDRGVQAKVLESGSLKFLERGGAPAFIGQFANGHRAVLQRQVGQTYTMAGAQVRIQRYGTPTDGKWPDLTRIKKLLGPAVPSMMANEEVQDRGRALLYQVLDQEIDKRISRMLKQQQKKG